MMHCIARTTMTLLAATVLALSLLASASAQANQAGAASGSGAAPTASGHDAQTITITRSGSQPSRQGPAANFTGPVRVDPLFQAHDPARTSGARVTFEPGARTAWHTHPLGQTLIVTAGSGLVQQWGGPIEEIRQGDVVWIPPGQKHWHGASPHTAMAHIAIVEQGDGTTVDWMEKVSNEQYQARKAHP
jgi:quercetin dioxygenase-like cupin family protein